MEKKNMVLLTVIAIATLLVAVVGATFAYFTASISDTRDETNGNGTANITTGQVAGTTVVGNIDGAAGKFEATAVYPGHKEVAAIKITTTGAAGAKTGLAFVYDVTANTIGAGNVKVSIYKSTNKVETGTENYFNCEKKSAPLEGSSTGETKFYEECTVNENTLGTIVGTSKTLKGGVEKLTITNDTITTVTADTAEDTYYYAVVEFVDTGAEQNTDMAKTLTGTITVDAAPVQ